ncbi:hypothetical protein [Chelativorans sp. AA-79]|uniref:hypothetical protein n=1 Tax=Chelativorans sp. AA-79 TaxID=3028735 RepID=UPI0023F8A66B|nr:hypothetical protein [Chelativorans sp. AA-79]WEX08830.1 hypothetical protein PVE73_22640 [Chelativorans sp. AA-79]
MRPKIAANLFPLTLSLLFVGASASSAHAYLDAGTGSMILQVLLGGIAGLAIAGKLYWHKFLTVIGVRRNAPHEVDTDKETISGNARAER